MRSDSSCCQENMSPVRSRAGVLSPLSEDVISPAGTEPGRPVYQDAVYAMQTAPDGRSVRIPVILKVYASNFGRYVVLAQDRVVARQEMGYVNLKNCTVKRIAERTTPLTPRSTNSSLCFQIIPRKLDGNNLTFCVDSRTSLDRWMSVLSTEQDSTVVRTNKQVGRLASSRRKSPASPLLLPALEEEE